MSLIDKYLKQSESLSEKFSKVREDNIFLFSQSGTNLSSVYWTKKVSKFPFKPGEPIYPYRIVNGVKVDKPIYPKGIIRVRLNSPAMQFIYEAGAEINWDEFKKLEGWYYG